MKLTFGTIDKFLSLFKLLRTKDALDISGFHLTKFEIVEKSYSVAILF